MRVRGYTIKDGIHVSPYKRSLPGYKKAKEEHWAI